MKKLLSMAICLIILLIPSFSAFASQDIYLEEAEVTFSLPDDWIVLTRGMADDDPNVLRGGYNAAELNKYFEENSIYLNAGPEGLPYELVITISDSEIQDFSLYSESELEDIGAAIDEDFASRGIQVNSYHLEDAGNESFIVLYHSQNHEDNPVYSKQYYTTNNYVAINFTLHSYTGTLESYMEQELDDIVNSVDFAITVDPEEDTDYAPTQAQEPFVPAADVPSDGVADSATAQASAESASGGSWIVIVLVAAAAVIAVVVIIAVVLSNKKKKQTPVPQGFTGAPPVQGNAFPQPPVQSPVQRTAYMNQSVPRLDPDDRTIILVDNQYNALDNNVQYGETKEQRIQYITQLKNSGIISEQEFESFRKTILEQ